MKRVTIFFILFALISLCNISYAQPGAIDTTFNPTDKGLGDCANDYIWASIIQNDGKIIIAGNFTIYNGFLRNYIARLNADGSIDTTFKIGTGADNTILSIALQNDGKIIIGGSFTTFNGIGRKSIARLNINGSLDTTFNPGSGANNTIYSTVIQSDGKIIIGGLFTSYYGKANNRISRLNTNGSIDTAFKAGTGVDNSILTMALQNDGKIIIGGSFTTFNGIGRKSIARLNINGSLDTTFNPGTGASSAIRAIVVLSNGRIIISGLFIQYNGSSRNQIARIYSDGHLDTGFHPGSGPNINGSITSTVIQSDGKLIVGGSFSSFNGIARNQIVRLHSEGNLDTTFNRGAGANSTVYSIVVQSDGEIFIGGKFTSFNDTSRNHVALLFTDGSLDAAFNPRTGANSIIYSSVIQRDGKIIIGGDFTAYNNTERNRIARLDTLGFLDTSFNPVAGCNNIIYSTVIQSDEKIIIGGDFTSYNGTSRTRIARLKVDGSLDATFNPGISANNSINSIIIQSDGKIIIVGYFNSFNGTARNRIARLNANGSLDASFDPGSVTIGSIFSIAIQHDDKIIIGGTFSKFNGIGRNRIARINNDGSLDATFNPGTGTDGQITLISIQNDGKIIICGQFTTYNGIGRNRIARINNDGSLDATFNPGLGTNGNIYSTAIQSDGKIIIGGDFTTYDGTSMAHIARLNTNGSLDKSFNPGSGSNGYIYSTAIQSDGKIIISGDFTNYNNLSKNRVARLLNCILPSGSIIGSTEVCKGQNNVIYTVPINPNPTSYIWSLPSGASGSSTSNSIIVNFSMSAVSGSISVKGTNACGEGTASTLAINVNNIPATPVISQNGYILHSNSPSGNQWYNQNGLLNGATNQDFTVSIDGNYYVIVTLLGCSSDTSNVINVIISGINSAVNSKSFKVYPNPVLNELILETEMNNNKIDFEIIDVSGQVIIAGNFVKQIKVQLSNLNPGVYFVKLINCKTIELIKIFHVAN